MWANLIVDPTALFDKHFRLHQGVELVAGQAGSSKGAVEAFAGAVVAGLVRIAVKQLHALGRELGPQVIRDRFLAPIVAEIGRHPVMLEQPLQHLAHITTVEAITRLDGQRQCARFVLDRQAPDCLARGVRIMHEVIAPDMIAELRLGPQSFPGDDLAPRRAQGLLQLRLLPQPLHTLAIHRPAALSNVTVGQTVTPVRILRRDPPQPGQELRVVCRAHRLIVERRTGQAEQPSAPLHR